VVILKSMVRKYDAARELFLSFKSIAIYSERHQHTELCVFAHTPGRKDLPTNGGRKEGITK